MEFLRRFALGLLLSCVMIASTMAADAFPSAGRIYFSKDFINDKISNGCGTLISEDGLFITAYHVVELMVYEKNNYPYVWICFEDHEPMKATYVCGSYDDDVAFLRIEGDVSKIQPKEIAKKNARSGDSGTMNVANHRPFDFIQFDYSRLCSDDMAYFNEVCFQGESGSAFLNVNGEIVGCLTGGWGICRDEHGNQICKDLGGGWVTYMVSPSMSQSTATEIRKLLKANGLLAEVDGVEEEPKQERSRTIIRDYTPFDSNLKGVSLYIVSMEGCPPCRKLKSLLPKWEAELMGMGVDRILICDKDEDRDVAKDLGCRAYPTVALVIDGKLVFRITGCPSKELLKSKVKEYIK